MPNPWHHQCKVFICGISVTQLLQLLIYGLVLGSIYALGAIGVSLTFGILRFANFAHGDLMTLGAYFVFSFVSLGWPIGVSWIPAALATALCAVVIDQLIYRRLRREAPVILLISSFGTALILRSLVQILWGPNNQVYRSGIQLPWQFWGLRIKPDWAAILLGAILLVVALHFFLQRTRVGKAMRAMADNFDLAKVTGIDTESIILWTWAIGAVLACAAGMFLGLDTRLHPTMGWRLLLPIFAAAILGGIGRPYGAIAGGLVIGVAEELSTLVISPAYKTAVAFAILVVMLIIRPTGLFGGRA
ncbi:branched-chain amino acid ABC transporter permease [Synechococcus sp. Nb3U1]|uniref:branched-chain amino acid ABC transporter permease n=1 Tax=Synechococcus sp. Nb3U1 TaxID=1914529 RepID=UPI001F30752F|nr:branched-chain amino acid ABC transporter permease [Synechococcus sp. Nb3U1]MCF2970317.1 branched-chain amino acid ABC transporter permease [Synechococcus sp. Nb3U1]